jgi:hypothetical protein
VYYVIVACLMCVLPIVSIAVDATGFGAALGVPLVAKWFVFWTVGVRLLLAGLRQVLQPAYTAKVILGLRGDESLLVVRELGLANLAIGSVGAASLVVPQWRLAGALAGGVFYTLAGVNHARQTHRNRLENVAMVSDLAVGILLLIVLL